MYVKNMKYLLKHLLRHEQCCAVLSFTNKYLVSSLEGHKEMNTRYKPPVTILVDACKCHLVFELFLWLSVVMESSVPL